MSDRTPLLQLLNSIAKPMASENKLGCLNTAVVGGTDAHVLSLVQRALDALDAGEISSGCEFPLQRLFDLWSRYAEADANERQHILDSTTRTMVLLRAADLRPDSAEKLADVAASSGFQHIADVPVKLVGDESEIEDDQVINEETLEMDAAQRHIEELSQATAQKEKEAVSLRQVAATAARMAAIGDWDRKPSFRDFRKEQEPPTPQPKLRPASTSTPASTSARTLAKANEDSGAHVDSELMYLKGIGPKRAQLLGKLGLKTVRDLLYYFPARYEDRRRGAKVADLEAGTKASVQVTVLYPPQTHQMSGRMSGRSVTKVRVGDETGRLDISWWNQPWREKMFQPGMQLWIYGKVTEFNGFMQMDTPDFEILSEAAQVEAASTCASTSTDADTPEPAAPDASTSLQVGRIVPVYPSTEGLLQGGLRRGVAHALEKHLSQIPEPLPREILEKHNLPALDWSLRQIHFPDDDDSREEARYRLVFEELFLLQVALAQKKMAARVTEVGIRHEVEDEAIKSWVRGLPFGLTGAQKRAMNEVRRDMKSGRPMNRLLHGDVGSGKTMVAAFALWAAHKSGRQGAILAPTEILAEQHFSTLSRLLCPLGIEVALLEGSLRTAQKRRIHADLNEGRVTVAVGTHALIQEGVEFKDLSLVVVDEQHRFGVMQRAALQQKGANGLRPDVLVMTATPIPRTLALTIYGDLDVSVLDELPPGRQPIKTRNLKPAQRAKAYDFIRSEAKKGRQAYVVCPLVEESEKLAHLTAATALAEGLRANELNDLRVGLVHGQMSVVERDEEMERFRAGMHDVLVSTTVIEVGVDVPNATIMVVEDAERFGLSQLHQLRGRVGRGTHKSYCFLLGEPKTDEGKARIQAMCKTQDGFEIAEYDLNLRGPGEFYGTRQSGLPDFRLANLIEDVDIIAHARAIAWEWVQEDPELTQHPHLAQAIARFWGEKLPMMQVS
jgi:ATP-dependent DNA helicase RecG